MVVLLECQKARASSGASKALEFHLQLPDAAARRVSPLTNLQVEQLSDALQLNLLHPKMIHSPLIAFQEQSRALKRSWKMFNVAFPTPASASIPQLPACENSATDSVIASKIQTATSPEQIFSCNIMLLKCGPAVQGILAPWVLSRVRTLRDHQECCSILAMWVRSSTGFCGVP